MTEYEQALAEYLSDFLTHTRKQRFTEVLENRTHRIAVVLVDLYQEHNASAILRSCDAFGIQDVYIVETYNPFQANREVSMGTDQWLTLHRFAGETALQNCASELKTQGFTIAATVLHHDSQPVSTFPFDNGQSIALLLGNEREGLSSEAIGLADILVHLPMYGFVESFNVSVASALCLQTLTRKLRNESETWSLPEERIDHLLLDWTRRTVPNVDAIEKRFRAEWSETAKME